MAKSKNNSNNISVPHTATRAPEQTDLPLIVNNIVLRSIDRSRKDVGDWRDAHKAAESIYYPNRTRLMDLYSDVELDGHLSGLIMKRMETVLNKKLRFVKDKKEVEGVCDLINTKEFREAAKEILKHIYWGVSGLEFLPGPKFCFKKIPSKHIKPEKRVIAINQTDYDGIPYEELDNIMVIGEERELGLLLKCAFYVMLKKGDFSDWANYIEIFGQPMIVTRYDTYDEKTKIQLTKLMEDAGASLRLSIPKQAELEIMDGKTSNGTGDLQDKFKDACNAELSVLVLGNTETTRASKSSGYAQSKEHGEQQDEIIQSDAQLLCSLLNSDKFKAILKSYGYQVEGGKFVMDEKMPVNEQKVRAEVYQILKQGTGLPVDHDSIYEEFGINKPADYEAHIEEEETEEEISTVPPTSDTNPANPKPPTKPGNKKTLGAMDRLLSKMADFFDQARKD